CSPSRVALNTGQYPMRYRIHEHLNNKQSCAKKHMAHYLDPNAPTLAKTLKQNGYATGHFGKWHIGGGRDIGDAPLPQAYGFDESLVSFEGLGNRILFKNDWLSDRSEKLGNGNIYRTEKRFNTQIYVDSALAFIKAHKDEPFFVHLFPNDVHDPFKPLDEDAKKFANVSSNPFEQKFLAVLTEMDAQLGRFYNELDKMKLLENTIVVFTSDNGPTDWGFYNANKKYPEGYSGKKYPPGFTGEFYGRKWSLYEGGIRMPFIISWKGTIPNGKTDEKTVMAAFDLFPSLCSMIGIEYPDTLDGVDKSAAFKGKSVKMTKPIMWEYGSAPAGAIMAGQKKYRSPTLAMRDGDYKILVNTDSTRIMLFDLVNDPGEKKNLVSEKPELAAKMAHQVLDWRRTMPVPIDNTSPNNMQFKTK
ncbi:MAG: sulfatase-like hydrolase/transferase, partial [Bacteroidales bacterium]|nr:sulfatase-like hydrolase/transferase [Bacteroidales bacterium]